MSWQSTLGLVVALAAVPFVASSIALMGHSAKGVPTLSSSFLLEMHHLSAEEINHRTLQLAATIKTSTK
jgi:hypothetical protein